MTLLIAGGLAMPGLASSQTLAAMDGAAMVDAAPVESAAAEQLRPVATSVALFAPARAQSRFGEGAGPYRQIEIEVEDDRDEDGIPFMIAGGILFIAGAIAGDDVGTILMLGGAGVGAYGAFIYFGGD
jgi:hypothetical protein